MPSREIHRLISKILTGYGCDRTHAAIDWPVKYLGNRHRIFFHDPLSAAVIGYLQDGERGAVSGVAHIVTDYVVSWLRKKV
ncbi:MAG TPA: hypothetical protein VJJ76_00565 [archaeon]|nr:hypothetical protein [archaeon]